MLFDFCLVVVFVFFFRSILSCVSFYRGKNHINIDCGHVCFGFGSLLNGSLNLLDAAIFFCFVPGQGPKIHINYNNVSKLSGYQFPDCIFVVYLGYKGDIGSVMDSTVDIR